MNVLLFGEAFPLLAPWLCGALSTASTALVKPIAMVKFFVDLPVICAVNLFYRNVFSLMVKLGLGLGIQGGLEAAIYTVCYMLFHTWQ